MKNFLLFLFCLSLNLSFAQVIVNVNVLKGGKFITPNFDENVLTEYTEKLLKIKGYNISQNIRKFDNPLVFDIFFYQFAFQRPTVVMIGRSKKGVHFIDGGFKRFHTLPKQPFYELVNRIIDKMPRSIDPDKLINVDVRSIFSRSSVSLSAGLTENIYKNQSKKVDIVIESDNYNFDNIFLKQFDEYMLMSINLSKIRPYIRTSKLILHLSTDTKGKFVIDSFSEPYPGAITGASLNHLNNFVRAIPTWIDMPVNSETTISITYKD